MEDDDYYAIGIDFGTTYSGVTWAWSGQPDDVDVIVDWPGSSGAEKVPTRIHFNDAGQDPDWGYDIPGEVTPHSWFKLLAMERQGAVYEQGPGNDYVTAARARASQEGRKPIEVITAYLKQLWKYTQEVLIRKRGEEAVEYTQFRVYLTVPAVWDTEARKVMMHAAKAAGLDEKRPNAPDTHLELVAEPECAALSVLNSYKGRRDIRVGDVFVVCDAGGGTVDLISYEVVSIGPIKVRECVEGGGGMCGAVFVDEEFEKTLQRSLKDRWDKLSLANRKEIIESKWEWGIKRQFDGRRDRDWTVTLPAELFRSKNIFKNKDDKNAEIPLENGYLTIKSDHLRTWFQRVLPDIFALVRSQVHAVKERQGKKPKSILLVGGFGSCRHLYNELQDEFTKEGITVIQPGGGQSWSAVCRGAVLRGLSDADNGAGAYTTIISRVSRLSYGVLYNTRFDNTKHSLSNIYWSEDEGEYRASNQMQWFLRRGEHIYNKEPVSYFYYMMFRKSVRGWNNDIYCCEAAVPPPTLDDQVSISTSFTVRKKITLEDMTPHTTPSGEQIGKLEYTVKMTTTGTHMEWKVLFKDEVLGGDVLRIEEKPLRDDPPSYDE